MDATETSRLPWKPCSSRRSRSRWAKAARGLPPDRGHDVDKLARGPCSTGSPPAERVDRRSAGYRPALREAMGERLEPPGVVVEITEIQP